MIIYKYMQMKSKSDYHAFRPCFFLDICPGVGLQDHMITLFLIVFTSFLKTQFYFLNFLAP